MELLDRIGLIMVICAMLVTVKRDADYLVKKQRKSRDSHEIAKDEPQTETEIAKAIVHKMIDDAVIAEDAYPDLRQKMHDAVDEYEPQTDCAWK